MKKTKAFTLIELLIVVAIIGILAAIAVPNFMNARIRAKLAASQSDINAIVTAVSMYRLDNNALPPYIVDDSGTQTLIKPQHVTDLFYLTTPVSYMEISGMESPFSPAHLNAEEGPSKTRKVSHGYWYYNWEYFKKIEERPRVFYWNSISRPDPSLWMVDTIGPNGRDFPYQVVENNRLLFMDYDPSNGILSAGIIQKHGL